MASVVDATVKIRFSRVDEAEGADAEGEGVGVGFGEGF